VSITIQDISAALNGPNEPDEISKREDETYEQAKNRALLDGIKLDIQQRKEYANKIYRLIVWWLVAILVILILSGFGKCINFDISDRVLITLISGTTINVLGIFAIVANYIFRKT
jgi:hypothetical protein